MTVTALQITPSRAATVRLFIIILLLSRSFPAPSTWFSMIPTPAESMTETRRTTFSTWLVTPTAAEALSETLLRVNVLTVPISVLRTSSTMIGTDIFSMSFVLYPVSIRSCGALTRALNSLNCLVRVLVCYDNYTLPRPVFF